MKKLYKYLLDAVVVSTVLACSACASMPVADPAVEGISRNARKKKLLYLLRYLSSQILISRIILKSSVIIVIA